jgi:predicted nucleotidyltransferase
MKAFLTGSHIYGNPTGDSDIDLVIRIEDGAFDQLLSQSDSGTLPLKFGKLNLIAARTDEDFAGWLLGKKLCLEKVLKLNRSLTKDECIKIHEEVRQAANLPYGNESKRFDR